MDNQIVYVVKEFEPENEIIIRLKKEVNNLTIQKAALLGYLDSVIECLPAQKRYYYRNKFPHKFVTPMDWTDELPYNFKQKQ